MINKPDYEAAATKAMQIIIENNITETPINPMPIILNYPGVRVVPYTKMATDAGMERADLIPLFGNQDAATFHLNMPNLDDVKYVVVYNMRLPFEIIWRGIARELGHIVLNHNGITRTEEARLAEALTFAHHLICPRPIIRMLQQASEPLTMNVLAAVTGCSDECVESMQKIPGVHIPKEINDQVRAMFEPHIKEYLSFHHAAQKPDRSPIVDFGSFMEGYEE